MSRLLISAAHKSSGKTTLSFGLCAALRERGLQVQPFKKGPDYIDPLWLGEAAGRACYNLDFYTQSDREIISDVKRLSQNTDLVLIEGNKGLYDGLAVDGSNSNAALARLLKTPVLLVLDARGMTRGIAPLVLGYQAFDRELAFGGIILNRVGGSRHESKLRAVLEHYTQVPVLGAVHEDSALAIVERHLGLMPSNEHQQARQKIAQVAGQIAAQVDLDKVLQAAATIPLPDVSEEARVPCASAGEVRLGIFRDSAFGFYYQGDLEALERAGAKLLFINALSDAQLPEVDGLFIGGGFPETRMDELSANHALRQAVRKAVRNGLPVYAECGGLMYLGRKLTWGNKSVAMSGALELDTRMCERPQGRGYVHLQETGANLWAAPTGEIHAHEFHYSTVENPDPDLVFAYHVLRGHGIDGKHDGIVYKNTLACYAHQRDVADNRWAQRFVNFIYTHWRHTG